MLTTVRVFFEFNWVGWVVKGLKQKQAGINGYTSYPFVAIRVAGPKDLLRPIDNADADSRGD